MIRDLLRRVSNLDERAAGCLFIGSGAYCFYQAWEACNEFGIDACGMFPKANSGVYSMAGEIGDYVLPVVLLGLVVNKISQYSEERDKIKAKKRAD